MEALKERLIASGIWDARLEAELNALEKYGIRRIGDEALRDAISGFLCIAPAGGFSYTVGNTTMTRSVLAA